MPGQLITYASLEKKTGPPQSRNPSVGINDAHIAKLASIRDKRNKKKIFRRILSLSIVTYLGYNFIYACGSPFDGNSDKPAICEAIDPIKLDLYKVYESEYYQTNIDPHVGPFVSTVSGLYNNYGVPAQEKLSYLHEQYGKPLVNEGRLQASQVYALHVFPKLSPYIEKSKIHVDQVKAQLQPYLKETLKQADIAQNFAKQLWNNLPTPVKEAKDRAIETVLEWYHSAENTDLAPILIDIYWRIVDFYQYHFRPFIQTHPATAHVNTFYDENVKDFVDKNVKPLLLLVKDRTHVDELFNHALTLLPKRPVKSEPRKATVASSIIETKTPVTATKRVSDIAITTPSATTTKEAVTAKVAKSKSKIPTKKAAEPASSAAPSKEKAVSTPVNERITASATATTATTTDSIATEATNAKDINNDADIVKPLSVRPATTPEYVEMKVESPQADKKEAVYCPTCNAAEEQVIIAPTDKNVIPVREEKEVFQIRTEKEVFEIKKEPIAVPPQSPVREKQEKTADAPNSPDKLGNLSPKPERKDQATKEGANEKEAVVISIQAEDNTFIDILDEATETKNGEDSEVSKDVKDNLPEPAVPLYDEESPIVNVVVDKQQIEIPLPIAKDEKKIVLPNDESDFADTNEQIVIQAPVKEDILEAEPIAEKPIVPYDESRFEAKSQHQQ
ncbi:hypothetical protein [Parasitella parasitica]|uniref:Uncharacterized protein n=1 Tax=Parasitella parasitica TaxID=35722 RepID=A0A0B7NQT4_9FUNG|nr:hypothetical protein [Parasitella parasitica]